MNQIYVVLPFTNRVTPSVEGTTKPDLYVQPRLARAIHKIKGFLFPNKDRVTRSVNSL